MVTFRAVLETASGLYRNRSDGKGYRRDELLRVLRPEVLSSQVNVRRVDRGRYVLEFQNDVAPAYDLLSRRRTPRS